jgi:hypothetical protein
MTNDPQGAPIGAPAQATPAGWYPEPGTGRQRYWTGQEWGQYAPSTAAPPAGPPAPQQVPYYVTPNAGQGEFQGGLVITGYILAVLIPLVGLILGIVTITRPAQATKKHGIWIILLSIVAFAIFYAALASRRSSGA